MLIYLASRSPRRKKILKEMGIAFRVVESRYREKLKRDADPHELAFRHALGKVFAARLPQKAEAVLAADTVVALGKKIFGKPRTRRQAVRMLKRLSGRSHEVYTAVALWDRRGHRVWIGAEKTRVFFKKLSAGDIQKYLSFVHPYDKAGSYAIQEGPKIVWKIAGSHSNVVGLPKRLVATLIRKIPKNKGPV